MAILVVALLLSCLTIVPLSAQAALGAPSDRPLHFLRNSPPTLNYGYTFAVRPATFYGWTADGSAVLGGPSSEPPLPNQAGGSYGHITWTVWNQKRAVGHGVVWRNDCNPSCGVGHWHSEPPTRVRAYRVRNGHFTRFSAKVDFGGYRHRIVFRYTSPYPPQWSW